MSPSPHFPQPLISLELCHLPYICQDMDASRCSSALAATTTLLPLPWPLSFAAQSGSWRLVSQGMPKVGCRLRGLRHLRASVAMGQRSAHEGRLLGEEAGVWRGAANGEFASGCTWPHTASSVTSGNTPLALLPVSGTIPWLC